MLELLTVCADEANAPNIPGPAIFPPLLTPVNEPPYPPCVPVDENVPSIPILLPPDEAFCSTYVERPANLSVRFKDLKLMIPSLKASIGGVKEDAAGPTTIL